MPLPATIVSGGLWPQHKNQRLGPFESGGVLYVVLQTTSPTVDVYKSTDGGDTWAVQDAANNPTSTDPFALDVVLSGTTLYVAYLTNGLVAQIRKFECSTDLWVALETGMTTSPPSPGLNISSTRPVFLCVRGDGDYVVFHNGATESVMGNPYRRIKYSRFQSGAWTNNVRVDGGTGDQFHWDARAAVGGSSSRSHFFYTKSTGGGTFSKTLTSANSLSTEQTASTSGDASAAYPYGNPVAYVDGANTKIVLPASVSGGNLLAIRATSGDSLSGLTDESNISASGAENTTSNVGAVTADGTTIYAFWADSAADDLWYDNDAGTGTWGTDVNFYPIDQSQALDNAVGSIHGATSDDEEAAQSFQLSKTLSIGTLQLFSGRVGSPADNIICEIVSSLGGTVLASVTVAASSIPTTAAWTTFTFASPPTLNGSTTYYIVLRRSGAVDLSNYITWGFQQTDVYANGERFVKDTGVWSSPGSNSDFRFRLPFRDPTIQGISVGKITNAIGVLYNDNGTVKYDKLVLTVPTKAPPAHLQLRYQRQAQRTTWRTAV